MQRLLHLALLPLALLPLHAFPIVIDDLVGTGGIVQNPSVLNLGCPSSGGSSVTETPATIFGDPTGTRERSVVRTNGSDCVQGDLSGSTLSLSLGPGTSGAYEVTAFASTPFSLTGGAYSIDMNVVTGTNPVDFELQLVDATGGVWSLPFTVQSSFSGTVTHSVVLPGMLLTGYGLRIEGAGAAGVIQAVGDAIEVSNLTISSVPEPGAVVLAGAGLAAMGLIRRARRFDKLWSR